MKPSLGLNQGRGGDKVGQGPVQVCFQLGADLVNVTPFILLVILTVPIGYAIGMATLVTLVLFSNTPLALITQNAITGVDSFPLMAIPFFMLAGNLMSGGGIAKRILNFFDTFMGLITGGLSMDDHHHLHVLRRHFRLRCGHHLRGWILHDPRDEGEGL